MPTERIESRSSQSVERLSFLEVQGFNVVNEIGHGAYAKVKLALSVKHNGTKVAIKIIRKKKVPREFLEKFLPRELAIVQVVSHPHLILFHQIIETVKNFYIVMEYAPKGSLLRLIKEKDHLPEYTARVYFKQLLDALSYLHNKGIVHRDLKCENLLLDASNRLKLIDFGFARSDLLTSEADHSPVLSTTYCGSLSYASPEVLKGIPYDPFPADIWATGVILYAMVCGAFPYNDSHIGRLIRRTQSPLKFPSNIHRSPELNKLLPRILAPLKDRYNIPGILNDDWTRKVEEAAQENFMQPLPHITAV